METIIGIYKITHKIFEKVYIGKSIDIYSRWKEHFSHHSGCTKLRNALTYYGYEYFDFEILEELSGPVNEDLLNELLELETFYIEKYGALDPKKGYNIKKPINNGNWSEDSRRKLSEAKLGKKASQEARENMRRARIGLKHSEETKIKIRENNLSKNKGKVVSIETRKKISESLLGHKPSQEAIDKMRNSQKGHLTSEETRKKISEAKRGKKLSQTARENMSKARTGLKHSEETKNKIKEAAINREKEAKKRKNNKEVSPEEMTKEKPNSGRNGHAN